MKITPVKPMPRLRNRQMPKTHEEWQEWLKKHRRETLRQKEKADGIRSDKEP